MPRPPPALDTRHGRLTAIGCKARDSFSIVVNFDQSWVSVWWDARQRG
jgi:hypothetical protein